jgi:hypothetical protein
MGCRGKGQPTISSGARHRLAAFSARIFATLVVVHEGTKDYDSGTRKTVAS